MKTPLALALSMLLLASTAAAGPVDVGDRASVVAFYYSEYLASEGVPSGYDGDLASCQAGSVTQAYLDAGLRRVNYFRAMVDLPPVTVIETALSAKCQEAALMMSANNALSHSPPASWTCYTADGAQAAGSSNLALGYFTLADAVTAWIEDSNVPSLGHRRWVLYPPLASTGFGAVTSGTRTYVMWVIGTSGPRPSTPEWVAWPPAGYVPYQFVPDLWSFSYPGAVFSGASVSVTRDGTPLTTSLEPVQLGYGDNALVWQVAGLGSGTPGADVAYDVTVSNVVVSGTPRTFSYTVTAIDPALVPTMPITWGSLKARYRGDTN